MTTEKDVKIHVKGLKKSFGHVHVLKGIDAEIKAGEVRNRGLHLAQFHS